MAETCCSESFHGSNFEIKSCVDCFIINNLLITQEDATVKLNKNIELYCRKFI
jgi:hypothetical protein